MDKCFVVLTEEEPLYIGHRPQQRGGGIIACLLCLLKTCHLVFISCKWHVINSITIFLTKGAHVPMRSLDRGEWGGQDKGQMPWTTAAPAPEKIVQKTTTITTAGLAVLGVEKPAHRERKREGKRN